MMQNEEERLSRKVESVSKIYCKSKTKVKG